MSKYKIGKDIGKLIERVKCLEEKTSRCTCQELKGGELSVRFLTEEEQKTIQKKKGKFCVYFVGGFVGRPCPNININDFICVSPCPPCPDIARLRIVDAQGNPVCTLIVRWGAAGGCDDCPPPGGHKLTWV